MKESMIQQTRKTKETEISLSLSFHETGSPSIQTELPFFDHLLTAMAFHGGFSLTLHAAGDIEVDPHHLVEDTGLVLGEALKEHAGVNGPLTRYGHAVIPMDEALAEAVVDFCGRPFLVYSADYPQPYSGDFDMSLLREFFTALTSRGGFTLHALIRNGENSHHMAEALFKALGKALRIACTPLEGKLPEVRSTKGLL